MSIKEGDKEAILLSKGILTMESLTGFKSWKKRWFVLDSENQVLSYYKKKGDKQSEGHVRIANASRIIPSKARPKKKNVLEIQTSDATLYMMAESWDLMVSWLKALTAVRKGKATNEERQNAVVSMSDFELMAVVGEGAYGKVLQVKKRDTGVIYAMKVLNKKEVLERGEVDNAKAEKAILQKLRSPFLVKLHFTFQTADKLYYVMDFINGGELFYHMQQEQVFDDERVRFYLCEILLGLQHLHEKGIVYRDLKPENLLLTREGHICMTDFGISKEGLDATDDRTATFCGTPEYLAPEVILGEAYTKSVDWWSFGTLMYEMLTGLPPFYAEDVTQMYQQILDAPLRIPKSMSGTAGSLVRKLLDRDEKSRLQDPEQIKKHPYFADIDWKAMEAKEVEPPFVPDVESEYDLGAIDPLISSSDIKEMEDETKAEPPAEEKAEVFEEFSYVATVHLKRTKSRPPKVDPAFFTADDFVYVADAQEFKRKPKPKAVLLRGSAGRGRGRGRGKGRGRDSARKNLNPIPAKFKK